MIQGIRSVLIGLTKEFGPDEASSALGYGLSLAQQVGAHATVQAASIKLMLTSAWVSDFAAGLVRAENQRLHALAEAVARNAQADAAASGVVCTTEAPQLDYPDLLAVFSDQARVHDLAILDAEPDAVAIDRGLIESLLINSGRPLVVVPPGCDAFSGERIVVAWDGSARAARAAGDALPFLRGAEAVEIVSVTGEKSLPEAVTGADLARHLSRHGVQVTVTCVGARDGDVAEALRVATSDFGANLLVMGGYVHSRLRELVFGGVTQSLLKSSPVPLFMSY
jgi:nucleotide-binding universal stress UspA family protein